MNRTFAVVITKVPGGQKPALSDGTKTIAQLFADAFNGESINGYQVQVDGETVEPSYVPEEGEAITVAKQVKGN